MPTAVSSAVCHELYDNPNKSIRRLLRFGPCCDGAPTVGGGVRKTGFKDGGEVRLSFSGF